jgi:type IV secretory pathway TraG/TraD family ATPase VirD4
VSVLLGLQELPQFKQQYGRETAETICAVAANVIS